MRKCSVKSYIRNKSRPKELITEEHLAEECMTFMSNYLNGVETSLNQPKRNQEYFDIEIGAGSDKFKNISRALSSK